MTSTHTKECLELDTDDKILEFVFTQPIDDETLYAPGSVIRPVQKVLPIQTLTDLKSEAVALGITEERLKSVKFDELRAIALVDSKEPNYREAERMFSTIIQQNPSYPSAYNNRAQLTQLFALFLSRFPEKFVPNKDDPYEPQVVGKKVKMLQLSAMSDLNQSIQLCYQLYPLFSLEGAKDLLALQEKIQQQLQQQREDTDKIIVPRVLIQSLCQRAILHKLRGNELLSFQDFKQAAALGGKMAKEELDKMNEFEKLNKETVFQVMKQLSDGLNQTAIEYQQQLKDNAKQHSEQGSE